MCRLLNLQSVDLCLSLSICSVCDQVPLLQETDVVKPAHRIAIIGAGSAGSSTAYHLTEFSQKAGLPINVTVFERETYIGGRSTTVNALDDPRYPVELGASIFVELNSILFQATQDFGLPVNRDIYQSTGSKYDLGIWDGEQFVFLSSAETSEDGHGWRSRLNGWWDIAKLLWMYGTSPIRLQAVKSATITKFLRMYGDHFPFADLTETVRELQLTAATGRIAIDLLTENGVSLDFAREIVQASTRVNYAQNLGSIHGLGAMVSMSADGAMSIDGGNWHIFEEMLRRSQADVRLGTAVLSINATSKPIQLEYRTLDREDPMTANDGQTVSSEFDTIVLAAPYGQTDIKTVPEPSAGQTTAEYVDLYVTLFTSKYRPSPIYFDEAAKSPAVNSRPRMEAADIPDSIITTLPAALQDFLGEGRGSAGLGPHDFWSLSTLRVLEPASDGYVSALTPSGTIPEQNLGLNETQYLYKIFSPERLTAQTLAHIFGQSMDDVQLAKCDGHDLHIDALTEDFISWSYEKTWQSYPYLEPRTEFTSFKLADRFWYTSAIEEFISTMETSALSGMNVARMIVDELTTAAAQPSL